MKSLACQIATNAKNNINALRLVLALSVILSHSFPLSFGRSGGGNGSEPLVKITRGQENLGSTAVNLFFLTSGLLITASWLRSKTMSDFLLKRVLRIYPAFIVAVLFTCVWILIFCPEFRPTAWHNSGWRMTVLDDCIFLNMNSFAWKGIFSENPLPDAGNGSLWTIQREFCCYLLVAAIGLFCLYKRRIVVLIGTLIFYRLYAKGVLAGDDVTFYSCRFLTYFMVGINFWLWRDKIPFSGRAALGCFAVLIISSQVKPWFPVLFPIVGGYCFLYLGYCQRPTLLDWTEKTDLSYGTYLYAFPVQQALIMNEPLRKPWLVFAMATPLTLLLASLSWNLVEKRFLAMKKIALTDFDPAETVQQESGPLQTPAISLESPDTGVSK